MAGQPCARDDGHAHLDAARRALVDLDRVLEVRERPGIDLSGHRRQVGELA